MIVIYKKHPNVNEVDFVEYDSFIITMILHKSFHFLRKNFKFIYKIILKIIIIHFIKVKFYVKNGNFYVK